MTVKFRFFYHKKIRTEKVLQKMAALFTKEGNCRTIISTITKRAMRNISHKIRIVYFAMAEKNVQMIKL